jgi:hypothetical protein
MPRPAALRLISCRRLATRSPFWKHADAPAAHIVTAVGFGEEIVLAVRKVCACLQPGV